MDQSNLVQCTYKVFTHDVDRRYTKTSPSMWPVSEDFQLPDGAKTPLNSAFQLRFGGDSSTGVFLPQIGEGQPRCLRCAIAESRRQQEADLPAVPYRIEHTTAVLSDWRRVMQAFEESVLSRLSDSPTGEELSYALRRCPKNSLRELCRLRLQALSPLTALRCHLGEIHQTQRYREHWHRDGQEVPRQTAP